MSGTWNEPISPRRATSALLSSKKHEGKYFDLDDENETPAEISNRRFRRPSLSLVMKEKGNHSSAPHSISKQSHKKLKARRRQSLAARPMHQSDSPTNTTMRPNPFQQRLNASIPTNNCSENDANLRIQRLDFVKRW